MFNQPHLRLLGLVSLLAAVTVVALWLGRGDDGRRVAGSDLLKTQFAEPAFQPGASDEELLALSERTAQQLVRDYPSDPKAISVQARRHYLLSQSGPAVDLWRQCLQLDANFADAYFGLGLVAMERGDYAEATRRFEDVARLDAQDPRVPVLLAKSRLLDGRPEDAVLILEQHVLTERTSAQAWEMLGQAHLQTQNYERAAACFEVAVQALPDMPDAVYGLSRAYAGLGQTDKAQALAQRFGELQKSGASQGAADAGGRERPDFALRIAAQTYADAARVRAAHGETQRAEEFLLRAVILQPANIDFLTQLQRSLQTRKAYDQAAEVGERIVEVAPQQVDHWLNLGWLYSALDQQEQAIAACQKAIALNPDDPRCRQAHAILQRFQ